MDGKEMLQKYVVVEGHRDVYEQLYRTSVGEKSPVRDAIAPRLIRDGINLCVYAISGDSYFALAEHWALPGNRPRPDRSVFGRGAALRRDDPDGQDPRRSPRQS